MGVVVKSLGAALQPAPHFLVKSIISSSGDVFVEGKKRIGVEKGLSLIETPQGRRVFLTKVRMSESTCEGI